MAGNEALTNASASHLLDERDLGRPHRSWFGVLVVLAVLVTFGIVGYLACIQLGTGWQLTLWPERYGFFTRLALSAPKGWYWEWESYVTDGMEVAALLLLVSPATTYLLYVLSGVDPVRRWHRREVDRRLAWAAVAVPLAAAREGQRVCLRGTVVAETRGFTTACGMPHAVLASYLGTVGGLGARSGRLWLRWELHGVDFALTLESGEQVGVRVAGGTLLPRPYRLRANLLRVRPYHARPLPGGRVAAVYREQNVSPGDVVEVAGVLSSEIDTTVEAGPRGTRLRRLIVSRPGSRLTIGLVRWRQAPRTPGVRRRELSAARGVQPGGPWSETSG
jgi:hypothetical protein